LWSALTKGRSFASVGKQILRACGAQDDRLARSRLVWVIDPERRLARIYRQDGSESILGEADALQGEDILPGFTCKLGAVLKTIV
jgi:Uma2 family endonuclease